MNAGRELDALAAEKVMGWTAEELRLADEVDQHYGRSNHSRSLPEFSTDIAAAVQVVERMATMPLGRYSEPRTIRLNREVEGTWSVGNYDDEMRPLSGWEWDQDEFVVTADTLPEAICLAALKAVGAEVPA